jgi:flagellar biosynthetic protein FliQ
MTSQQVIDIATRALIVSAKLAGPFLAVVLAVGVTIGLLQSVTQLQEQTLTFVPKLVGAAIVIAVSGNWMLASLVEFSRELMLGVPSFLEG